MSSSILKFCRRACLALLTVSLASVAAAAGFSPLAATVAFHEDVTVVGTPPCVVIGQIEGEGILNGEHVTTTSTDCVNPVPPTNASFAFTSNNVVLTMDDGSQLWAAYGGILTASTGSITGAFVIYGGTGRFAHAKGSGAIQGFENFATGEGLIQLTGKVQSHQ